MVRDRLHFGSNDLPGELINRLIIGSPICLLHGGHTDRLLFAWIQTVNRSSDSVVFSQEHRCRTVLKVKILMPGMPPTKKRSRFGKAWNSGARTVGASTGLSDRKIRTSAATPLRSH